ncbi:MAG TPA: ABC transporter permease [Solirubrobacteraceae bacterium]|nr:ABC transporter permease [Solirubrobacteraceae bacterium]
MAVTPSDVTVPGALEAVTGPSVGPRSRLRSGLGLWIPAGLVALIFFLCFVWPLIGPVGSPTGGNILEANLPIGSAGHVLGTDQVGNDEWARLLYGGRASLEIALAVNALGIVVGGLLGALAAYLGDWRDAVIMRVLDVFIAFPALVLAIAIAEGLGPSEVHTIWALSFFSVPAFARLARAETLRIRELNFIAAAGLSGTGPVRTLVRHVMPNIVPQLMTFALLGMGIIIVLEGALSFLGLGVPPPAPSWGNMISAGESVLSVTPRFVFIPSIALFVTVVSFNLLGDALRSRWSQR